MSDNNNTSWTILIYLFLFSILAFFFTYMVLKDNKCCCQPTVYAPGVSSPNYEYSSEKYYGFISIPADDKRKTGLIRIYNKSGETAYAIPYSYSPNIYRGVSIGDKKGKVVSFKTKKNENILWAIDVNEENGVPKNSSTFFNNVDLTIDLHNSEDQHGDQAHKRFHMNKIIDANDFSPLNGQEPFELSGNVEGNEMTLLINRDFRGKIIQMGTDKFYFTLETGSINEVKEVGLTIAEIHHFH